MMELSDGPPGTEGYQDSVAMELPKKPSLEDCTKAEEEFHNHLSSLKIRLEDGSVRCMVERLSRDNSGKWVYLCFPCGAVCSGEAILQTHISGKKHKCKLVSKTEWPLSIFEEHPALLGEKMKKPASQENVKHELPVKEPSELDLKYMKYKNVSCHIQETLDQVEVPVLGTEYLVEHPPEQAHYEPSYTCTLCAKQGHPRTIVNHMTCFWHRYNYLLRHFFKACTLLSPFRTQNKYRSGVNLVMNRLSQRIEEKFGRMKPIHIDKEVYEKDRENIHRWIFSSHHFSENDGNTFEEVVDAELIESLSKAEQTEGVKKAKKDPSPPVVAAPSRPNYNARQREKRESLSLSDVSDDEPRRRDVHDRLVLRDNNVGPKARYEPYPAKRRVSPYRSRYNIRNEDKDGLDKQPRPPNYEHKLKMAQEKQKLTEESLKKTLAYHEKNPEKHPLYPEEWKKFWNRRYKEIQADGKDPSKHDFKPEWIVFWTKRMKELHEEELRIAVEDHYNKLRLTPPNLNKKSLSKTRSPELRKSPDLRKRSPDLRRRSPELRRRSLERRRSPGRRRSPDPRRRSPEYRNRKSPDYRRRSPDLRRRSPNMRKRSIDTRPWSPTGRRRSPEFRKLSPHYRRDLRYPLKQKIQLNKVSL